ncbi:hypothetical protein EC973_005462 [Apophysomyces ossiformis]|uniref:NAD(+) kinase n=1 Tax=Apophysomyces ossiformis TaxID=679940 RepID=A0A8H7BWE9_9FUNG|nr:hypothetical protein EC973_005462 [Apophysomyces ossiformis]
METAWVRNQLKRITEKSPELSKQTRCYTTVPCESFEVLNELVVDRGPSPYMSMLELFGDEQHLTTVQADGICIATPTGSTAYSLSAQGSLTHPDIRCTLVTPICPHTLNFRPMLLPEAMTIRIAVPFNSRSTAYCSFDGRNRVELQQGDHVKVTISRYPLPTVCGTDTSTDWFASLQQCLQWNVRERQKSFVVLETSENQKPASPGEGPEDSMFACIRHSKRPISSKSSGITIIDEDTDTEENDDESWDLPAWNDDEMSQGLVS